MTSNNLKIYDFDPKTILQNQGITEEEINAHFDKFIFDF
jgi:hypothetical protein